MESRKKTEKKRLTKRSKKNIAVITALIMTIIIASCYTLFIKPLQSIENWEYMEYTVQHGTLQNIVTESGSVSLGITTQLYDLDISTDSSDDEDDEDDEEENEKYLKVEEVYAAVGQRVKEGDQVYQFTQESIDSVRKALTYEKTEKQIALAQVQTQYEIGVLEAELSRNETLLDTSLAQTVYDTAIARLSNEMSAKSLEIQQLLKDIYQLQCDLTDEDYLEEKSNIIEAYENAIKGVEDASEDFVTNRVEAADTFLSAKTAYENFFNQFDESNKQITDKVEEVHEIEQEILYNQTLLEKELLAANQELATSNVNGSIADVKYESSLTSHENARSKAQRELDEAAEKLDAFEAFIGDGTVYAEGSGIVTEVGYEEGDYLMNTGTLIAFAKAEDMTVSVDVAQEDVVTMKVGDSVDLSISAYEEEAYNGIIESITTTATSRSSATISYPVVISIQGDTSKLYGGMTADVAFVTEEAADISYVLRKAIVEKDGKSCLYIKSGENYVLAPVTTGFTNGEYIEVKDGIQEGDCYYIKTLVNGGSANEE